MPDDTPDFGSASAVADQPDFEADSPDFGQTPPLLPGVKFINPNQPSTVPVIPTAGEAPSTAELLRKRFAPQVLQSALQTSPLKLLPAAEQRVITPTAALVEAAKKHPESGFLSTSAGLAQGIGAFTDFFSSPEGIAMLGTGNVEPAVQRGIAAAFSGQMISQTPELARQLGDEIGKPPDQRDPVKIASLVTQGVLNVAGAAATGAGALRPSRVAPEQPPFDFRARTPQPLPESPAPPAKRTAPGLVSVGGAFDKALAGLKAGGEQPDFGVLPESDKSEWLSRDEAEATGPAAVQHIMERFGVDRDNAVRIQAANRQRLGITRELPQQTPAIPATVLIPVLDVKGKAVAGGSTHDDIVSAAVARNDPQAEDIVEAAAQDKNHKFIALDAQGNPTGPMFTRLEAVPVFKRLTGRDVSNPKLGLQSQDLKGVSISSRTKEGVKPVPPIKPQPDWRVVVQGPKEGAPGFVQIIDPRSTEASRSPTVESLRAAGVEVPDLSRLPEGSYTWKEAVEMAGKPAAAPRTSGKAAFFLRPRSDGVPDILDAIQEEGGIRPPGEKAGGEYDGYKRSMSRGAASLLRNRNGKTPDLMIQALQARGWHRIQSHDDLWDAILGASGDRDELRAKGGGPEAQEARFWDAATNPKNPAGMMKISVDDLKIGHKFRLRGPDISNEELEVTHIDPETGEVTVKDGRKLGVRTLPEGTEIWVQRSGAPEEMKRADILAQVSGTGAYAMKEEQPTRREFPSYTTADLRRFLADTKTPEATAARMRSEISRRESGESKPIVTPQIIREEQPLFGPPESVGDQQAREERERAAQLKKAQAEELKRRAAKPLTGSVGDIGQTDFAGGEDLFSLRETATAANLDRMAQRVHGKGYAELEPWQQDAIRQAVEAKQSRNVRQLGQLYGVDTSELPPQFWERAAEPYQSELELSGRAPEPASLPATKKGPVSRERALKALSYPPSSGKFSAAFEEGAVISSIEPDQVPKGVPNFSVAKGTVIRSPLDFVKLLIPLRTPYAESLKIVLMDQGNRVIHSETLYGGTLDTTSVDYRDVVRLKAQFPEASRVMISHNHPSGDPYPSSADDNMTRQWRAILKEADLELVDHVITDGDTYYSYLDKGVRDIPNAQLAPWERMRRSGLQLVADTATFSNFVRWLRQSDQNHAHIIYLNTRLLVTAIERTLPDWNIVQKAATLGSGREGARSLLIDWGPNVSADTAQEWTRKLNINLRRGGTTQVSDAAAGGNLSFQASGYFMEPGTTYKTSGQTLREEPSQSWHDVRTRRDEAATRMASLQQQVSALGGRRNAPVELKNQLDNALAEQRRFTAQLRRSPEYVEDLLKQMEGADQQTMDSLAGELAMVEPSLLNKVYADMQKRGVLPPSAKLPEPFSSLQALTDWLTQNKVDSPRRPILERLNIARRAADALTDVRDRVRHSWASVVANSRAFYEAWKSPPLDDDYRAIKKDWFLADTQSDKETWEWQQQLNRQIENPRRRWALMAWIQARGDENLLRLQLDSVPDRYRPVWEAALKLTPSEKALANQVRADWAQKLETGKNAGMLDEGRENYGPTIWKVPPKAAEGDSTFAAGGATEGKRGTPGNPSAKLDTRDPFFTFHKSYPTFFDGIMAEGVPETMDVAKLVGYYNQAFNKALSSRAVVKAALEARAKRDGLPIVILSGRADPIGTDGTGNRGYVVDARFRGREAITADGRPYVAGKHPALRDWKFLLRTEEGKPILSRADMLIHPDYAKDLENVLGGRSIIREYAVGRALLKTSRFVKESLVGFSPFHMATLGEEAAFKGTSPLTTDYKIDLTNNIRQRQLVRAGVDLGFSSEQVDFEEGLAGGSGGLFGLIPGLGDVSRAISDMTFKEYLPKIKMKTAEDMLERNLKWYKGQLTEGQIYDLTASQANANFGIQNYRLIGRSPFVRDICSLLGFAPDFLESRMKSVAQAFKPFGREQQRRLVIQAASLYIICRAIQTAVDPDNDPHWNWKDAFTVVYKGRRYGIRTVLSDIWTLLTEPRQFISGRTAAPARIGVEAVTGRDWRGVKRDTLEQMDDAMLQLVPMWAQGLVPGARGRDESLTAAAGRTFGVMSRRDTPGMRIHNLAADFNRSSSDPAARSWQKARDQETLPDSDYRRLDTLLEANELKAAKKEYDQLVASGHRAVRIAARFRTLRPFTGTRERDLEFYNSLTDEQKKVYDRAKTEQQEQAKRFFSMFRSVPQTNKTEDVPAFAE